ncbi:MAG: hypothetical protein RIA69_02290 [Cyclobacteriaceae bacterium]
MKTEKTLKKIDWKKFAFEFLSIFVALISAFALNNWNDQRKNSLAESKILLEILNGLEADQFDVETNVVGHQKGLRSCDFWVEVFNGNSPDLDTLQHYYFVLTRDFISIQNVSGYETLKSRGFELIKNDSLRTAIISLYEYDYQNLRKLEEEYNELQFQENYFNEINKVIAPHFIFDSEGNIEGMKLPIQLNETDRKIMLSYIWKIRTNRQFILSVYNMAKEKQTKLIEHIEAELSS